MTMRITSALWICKAMIVSPTRPLSAGTKLVFLLTMTTLMVTVPVQGDTQEMCFSRQHQNTIVNVRVALTKPGTAMDSRYVQSERDCVLACCSQEVKPGISCTLAVYNPNKPKQPPNNQNCYLFHCETPQDCPLMTAQMGINSFDISKGQVRAPTVRLATTSQKTTEPPAPTTPTNPLPTFTTATTQGTTTTQPTTTATTTAAATQSTVTTQPTSTTTTLQTTTTTTTTTTQPTTTTTQSITTQRPIMTTTSALTIIIIPIPITVEPTTEIILDTTASSTTTPTTTTTTNPPIIKKPNKPSKKQNKSPKKSKPHPVVATTTSPPILTTTAPTPAKTTTDQPTTAIPEPTMEPTTSTTVSTTTLPTPTATITTTTTTTVSTTTTTTTMAPTEPLTTRTTTAPGLVFVPQGARESSPDLQDPILPGGGGVVQGKGVASQGSLKTSLVAVVVVGLVILTLALAVMGRKAMESFDRRHYTRLELNDLHYEV